ncbi:hypothetical protein BJ165DRAFT_1610608 [Panaeolus papilionaceus]|nr:hypothetical protein BJ165DRAFT_1610608 [Panaeolus papilionaceus]
MLSDSLYDWIQIQGPLSITPTTAEDVRGKYVYIFCLMGPTGCGKSMFVESLCPGQNLSISKDSLESVTQEVVCYLVHNICLCGSTVVVMDTPGFLDTKFESTSRLHVFTLYFHPITDVRLGGTKQQSLDLMKAFADKFGCKNINFVTTMWNMVFTPKQIEQANRRFDNLEAKIYKSVVPVHTSKFLFSTESAFSILDKAKSGWYHNEIHISKQSNSRYQSLSRNLLLQRIENIQRQLQSLSVERAELTTTPGAEVKRLLCMIDQQDKEASMLLQWFAFDLFELDTKQYRSMFPEAPFPPPIPRRLIPSSTTVQPSSSRDSILDWWKNVFGRA